MNERTDRGKQPPRRLVSRRVLVVLATVLVVGVGLSIVFNAGGLRARLFGGIDTPRIGSIVVLPLRNLSGDARYQYLANGIGGELSYDLSLIGAIRVIAPDSANRYRRTTKSLPDIARELNADGVVQGGVQAVGDKVRVVVNLTQGATGRGLWEHTYECNAGDTPIVLGEVSRAIAARIGASLTPEQDERFRALHSVNPKALDSYLRAEYGGAGSQTEALLKQAIDLDPTFAMPSASLAGEYYWSNFWPTLAPHSTYPRVKEAAQQALRIDPMNAPAHFYSALVAADYDWNFAEAERQFKRNIQIRPNCADTHHLYAHFLLSMGRMDEAVAETRRALEIDPADAGLVACVAWHDVTMGRYDEAEKHCSQAMSMGANGESVHLWRGWAFEQRGRFDDAITEFQKAVVASERGVLFTAALGHAYAVAGNVPAAREVLNTLIDRSRTEYVSPYEIAAVYAGLGDRDSAFEWLDKALAERASFLAHVRMDPRIWSLHSDARFRSLLTRMALPASLLN